MYWTPEILFTVVASCDERIASIKEKIDFRIVKEQMLRLLCPTHTSPTPKDYESMKNLENNVALVKIEKLIYLTLSKLGNKIMLHLLLEKYASLMTLSYENSSNMVQLGCIDEIEHLDYCKNSLCQHKYIKTLCERGITADLSQ